LEDVPFPSRQAEEVVNQFMEQAMLLSEKAQAVPLPFAKTVDGKLWSARMKQFLSTLTPFFSSSEWWVPPLSPATSALKVGWAETDRKN
jgi:hypothetical protein